MAKRWYYKDENGNKVPVPQYKINADDYYTKTVSDSRYYEKSATDTLLGDKVSKSDIVQSTGTSTTAVMSQKAVSDAIAAEKTRAKEAEENLYKKVYGNIEYKDLSLPTREIIEAKGGGIITNYPDEEDITVIEENGKQKLKFADRNYNPQAFSGKGYKILRKNWQPINGERKNVLTQEMISEPNTIYEIRYEFDLNGAVVIIPKECIIKFCGGTLINGSIRYNDTIISGEYIRNIKTVCKGKVLGYANVFMYGASGNGIDDDTLALNNAVQSGCSAMHIPAGNYLISYYIMPIDNINIYGDGDATIITNIVETSCGKGAFLVGYVTSRKHYPSQYSIDVHNCTIGDDFAEVESEVESGTYDIGDIVILRDTTLLDDDTFKALYVNRIIKKDGNKLYFERKINNHFLFEASTVVIGNFSKLRASSSNDDIDFIKTPYWPYKENTCHVAYNVTISNLSIDEKYPYTGSGLYGIFINGYECHIQNVKMLNVTSPFGSNISAFCSYTNITAHYSGGISDMAELQIENIFDNITFLSKGKHPIHYGESFTLGNGYGNILSRFIIYGPNGAGNINFISNPDSIIINSQLYNLYRPDAGNAAISGARYGETTIMNCYIRNKNVGVVEQGALTRIIGCVFDTEGAAIGENPNHNYYIVSCISKNGLDSDEPILENPFGGLKPITRVNMNLIGVSPNNTEILFNENANIKYGTYAELEATFKYYTISINITIGDESKSVNLTSDNTYEYIKLRLIRVRTGGIRLMLYKNNALINDIAKFIESEDLSILPFIISVTNNNSNYTAIITRPILNIYN